MIDKSTVDRIFMTADIVEIVGDFITLQKKGTNYQACCPFHGEKTPSFVVSPSKGIYKCFGCGKGGNAISFIMEHESMSYADALKYVAKKYGIEIVEKEQTEQQKVESTERENMMLATAYATTYFREQLTNSNEGRNIGLSYFRERGFTDTTIEKFQLGYCLSDGDMFSKSAIEKGYKEKALISSGLTIKNEREGYYDRFTARVIFPILSISGRTIGFGGRILTTEKKKAKYLNSPESEIYHKSNTLYGLYHAKRSITAENRCILVEGYTDVISMHQAGIENVVASSGTSLTTEQIILIRRFTKNVTIIYDGDSAGIKASLRGIDMVLKEGLNVRMVLLPEGEDPDSFVRSHSATDTYQYIIDKEEDFISFKTKLLLNEAKNDPIKKSEVIHDVINSISVIPDDISRAQYIKECSRLMDADETMLSREVMRRIVSQKSGKVGVDVFNNSVRKERYMAGKQSSSNMPLDNLPPSYDMPYDIPYDVVPYDYEYAEPAIEIKKEKNSLFEMEKELVIYLLKDGESNFTFTQPRQEPIELNIAEVIIEEMDADGLDFLNPTYNSIFSEYKKLFNESEPTDKPRVSINNFINNCDVKICDFVVNVLTYDDINKQSRIWTKHIKVEKVNIQLSEAIPKCIALYKLKRLEFLISKRKDELKIAGENFADILKAINLLNDSRKSVCEKYERIL